MRLQIPERSVSPVYEDDRKKDRYVINVRGVNMVTIERFYREDDAQASRDRYIKQGYAPVEVPHE